MSIEGKLLKLYRERPIVKSCDELIYYIGLNVEYDYTHFKGIEVKKSAGILVNNAAGYGKGEIHLIKREDLLWQLN